MLCDTENNILLFSHKIAERIKTFIRGGNENITITNKKLFLQKVFGNLIQFWELFKSKHFQNNFSYNIRFILKYKIGYDIKYNVLVYKLVVRFSQQKRDAVIRVQIRA